MNPLVTISIPLYRCEKYILNCLKSIHEQRYKNIEVILVNDLTPDDSVSLVENFINDNQLVDWSVINLSENSGLSVVRNEGIKHAKGKYIFFIDSDDEIYPDTIESLVNLAESTRAEVTMGEVETIRLPSKEKINMFPLKTSSHFLQGNINIFDSFVNGDFPVSSWNKLILLDFIKSQNLYFTKGLFAQDSLHTFEMALCLESISILRQKTYRYFLHQDSVIHNRKKIHFDNWITIAQKINEYLICEKNSFRKKLILRYLVNYKAATLEMNWKAQQNEELWKYSYREYLKLEKLSLFDYISNFYSNKQKKQDLFYRLPVAVGYKFFRWRYNR